MRGGIAETIDLKHYVTYIALIIAYGSVDLFGIISGYLLCEKNNFKSYRILELLCVVLFWCIVATVCFFSFKRDVFDGIKMYLKALFPPFADRYWYITNYFGLFIIMPYLNIGLQKMNTKQLGKLVFIIVVMYSIVPEMLFTDLFRMKQGYSMIWLTCLYVIGAYLKRTDNVFARLKNSIRIILWCLCILLLLTAHIMIYFVFGKNYQFMLSYTSPFILLMVIIVMLFATDKHDSKDSKENKLITFLSAAAFDVYIIHSHILVFDHIITGGFTWLSKFNFALIPIICLLVCFGIYLICTVMFCVRKSIFKILHFDNFIEFISNFVDKVWL